MRYAFTLDGRTHHVTLEEHADGPRFIVDGQTYTPEVEQNEGTIVVKVDDATHRFRIQDQQVSLNADVLELDVVRAKPVLQRAGGKGRRGQGVIKPPMPGKVVEVHVREGDEVQEGSPILVLEAMKMQNDLKSPIAGLVRSVKVKVGQNVDASTVMVEIEPASND